MSLKCICLTKHFKIWYKRNKRCKAIENTIAAIYLQAYYIIQKSADYPDCPIIRINQMYYYAFFPAFFKTFPAKIYLSPAGSQKEIEKMLLFFI